MIFEGKQILDEEPSAADSRRQNYIDGINRLIQEENRRGKDIREGFASPESMAGNREYYRKLYRDMLGIDRALGFPCSKKNESVYAAEDDTAFLYRLTVWIGDFIPFYCMLLMPKGFEGKRPLAIGQHGGGGTPELCSDMNGRNNYNHMNQRLLKKGCAVLAPQIAVWAQETIPTAPGRKVKYDRGKMDAALKRFGMSMTGLEIAGIMNAVSFVSEMPEIDAGHIAMIGISYGGYFTLHTMAADTRIKAGYDAAAFNDRDEYPFTDWTYPDSGEKFQDAEVAGLCAPRKLYLQVGKEDGVFDWRFSVSEAERAKKYFDASGCPDQLRYSVWDGGHTIPDSDEGIDFILG